MSDSELGSGSLVIPTTQRTGKFRCGICWSDQIQIRAALAEDGNSIVINVWCACGNSLILQTDSTEKV